VATFAFVICVIYIRGHTVTFIFFVIQEALVLILYVIKDTNIDMTEKHIQTVRDTDSSADRQTDKQTDRQRNRRQTEKQLDRQTLSKAY
jgi:hypothetical protein